MSFKEIKKQDVAKACEEIMQAGNVIVATTDVSPSNKAFHDARYKLFRLACATADEDVLCDIACNANIQCLTKKIFPVSCRAGIYEECDIARSLLADDALDFDKIYRSYYGDTYRTLMDDELAFLDTSLAGKTVAYIGGGAMPVPALLMAKEKGCQIVVVDPHKESCDLAGALAAKLGLENKFKVVCKPGEVMDYSGIDMVWIANWIERKEGIFKRISGFADVSNVIVRSAARNSLSFIINDPVDADAVCPQGYELLHTTAKRDSVSLESMIFRNKKAAARGQARSRRVVDSVMELIGNTPLLRLPPEKTGLINIDLYAKLEHLNPFGSVKDRTALAMLGPHIGKVSADRKKILELSSGNAARALQAIASIHGTMLETVSNRIRIDEMRKLLKIQGARISPLPEGTDTNDAYAALNVVDDKAKRENEQYFYTDQYRNAANLGTHYKMTGGEIIEDLGKVDYFVGSIGTAGSSVGVSRYLKEFNADLDITGVVSEKDDFIPGIRHKGEIFDIGPYEEKYYNRLIDITAQEAIDGILDLVRLYGVMAGPSSGAAYHAALRHLRSIDATLSERRTAVFIVCDRMEPYISYIEQRRPELFA